MPKSKPKQYTFSLSSDSPRLTVRALIKLLEHALSSLRRLDPDLPAEWEAVKVKLRAPFALTFQNPSANGSVSKGLRGVRDLSKHRIADDEFPPVSDAQIETAKELAELVSEQDGLKAVRVFSDGKPVLSVTPRIAENVKAVAKAIQGSGHQEWTTARGVLDQITVSDQAPRFRISDQITASEIPCSFDMRLLEDVKAALPSLIEVHGMARFNRHGEITSMHVESIRQLPKHDLTVDEMVGIDITGGADSAEYLERVRGGD